MSAHHSMLKEIKIADISVGSRHRKDMGDLTTLAESIRQEGLLQPIGVTDRLEPVFGERRLRATRDILKKKTILARIVDVSSILAGEYHENEAVLDFDKKAILQAAKEIRQRQAEQRQQHQDAKATSTPQERTPASHPADPG